MRPGVRRAGPPRPEPAADAGPAAPQAPLLIQYGPIRQRASLARAAAALARAQRGRSWHRSATDHSRGIDFRFSEGLPRPGESTTVHLNSPDDVLSHLSVHGRPYVSTTVVSTALADGLLVPKPSCGARCQRRRTRGLRQTVRGCPLASTASRGDCHSLGHSAVETERAVVVIHDRPRDAVAPVLFGAA
jgi:hypothetical protein